jgi:hypothetical protein
MNLNTEEVGEFTDVLHLILCLQCCLQNVDVFHVPSKDYEMVHPHCDDNFRFFVDVYDAGGRFSKDDVASNVASNVASDVAMQS